MRPSDDPHMAFVTKRTLKKYPTLPCMYPDCEDVDIVDKQFRANEPISNGQSARVGFDRGWVAFLPPPAWSVKAVLLEFASRKVDVRATGIGARLLSLSRNPRLEVAIVPGAEGPRKPRPASASVSSLHHENSLPERTVQQPGSRGVRSGKVRRCHRPPQSER